MKNRTVAIFLNNEQGLARARKAVSVIMANAACAEITVFSKNEISEFNIQNGNVKCFSRAFPPHRAEGRETSIRNAILRQYEDSGFRGILHVISDSVELLKDPGPFMDDLENMMQIFDYPVWLSTVSDPCNYVYSKYNPRFTVTNDASQLAALGLKCDISFTSHSNTAWIAYDMSALQTQKEIKYFSEDFTVAMFYIIEFLARRRAYRKNGQLFFMNQYMTVGSELGVYRISDEPPSRENKIGQETMQAEDLLFRKMNVNYAPDNNIDLIIDLMTKKIIEKTGKNVSG